jgi:hypothetical protein
MDSLTEDVASVYYPKSLYESHFDSDILSLPWNPCDMSTLAERDLNRAFVSLAPSYAPAEELNNIIFYENERGYAIVADAIVDDCQVYFYRGTLYNIPADANAPPPFTCVAFYRGFQW